MGIWVCVHMHKYTVPARAEAGIRFSEAGVRDDCKPPNMGAWN